MLKNRLILLFTVIFIATILDVDALYTGQQDIMRISREGSHHDNSNNNKTILFLPLDERFTTRFLFLNLASLSKFNIVTPDIEFISQWKTSANLTYIDEWIENNLGKTDIILFSAEMYLYGGLIRSRISDDSTDAILQRLEKLVQYKTRYPNLRIYVSSVVMRIPAYSLNFEEPDYWGTYGLNLYQYSFYQDRFNQLHNISDLVQAQKWLNTVPKDIVNNFLWRRARNHNVSVEMLNYQHNSSVFEQLYITLDDNAEYGFNIRESQELKDLVSQYKLDNSVHIYPGADEVGLTMLSKVSLDSFAPSTPSRFLVIYRNTSTQNLIPNYEGQPMNLTILEQIKGAGGILANGSRPDDYDILLLVNNFDTVPQTEAPNQPPVNTRSFGEFDVFIPYIQGAVQNNKIVGFADNRYSNGGDQLLYHWICKIAAPGAAGSLISLGQLTYAGWNTDGNKLGTVISNSVILSLFQSSQKNEWFQLYRFLEDIDYQSDVRQQLTAYVGQVSTDSINNLAIDLAFYERFVWKLLNTRLTNLVEEFQLPYKLSSIYFPWKRSFEIGMIIA